MSILILSLPPSVPVAGVEWHYVLSSDGRRVLRSGHCSAQLLPAPGRAGETVAVVPLRQLSWQRVTLPQGALASSQRLRTVLQGMLEEQLLDDPDSLHFALAPHAAAGVPIWIAVCDRAWLRACLRTLEAAGHRVDRIVPAHAPGATASGGPECTLIGTPGDAFAVLTGVDDEQAVSVMPLQAQGLADRVAPATLLRAEPAVAELAERTFGRPVALQSLDEGLLVAARGAWDLPSSIWRATAASARCAGWERAPTRCGAHPSGVPRAGRWACSLPGRSPRSTSGPGRTRARSRASRRRCAACSRRPFRR